MSTVLRIDDSAGFLASVPALTGFTPRQSIVLVPFDGRRSCGAMRIDLPRDDVDEAAYAEAMIGLLARVDGADALAVVVYADDPPLPAPTGLQLPGRAALDELLRQADRFGLRLIDALCVTPDGWADYRDPAALLRPLDEISPSPEVPGIADVSGDQHSGAALPPVGPDAVETVARALRELEDVLSRQGLGNGGTRDRVDPQALAAAGALDDLPRFFEDLLDCPENPAPFATATLLWCLDRPLFRDVAILQWATDLDGGRELLEAQLAAVVSYPPSEGPSVPDRLGGLFLGQGPRPGRDRLGVALTVVRNAAARAPRSSKPGVLTAAAWLSWALGRSTHAASYVEAARQIDPDYRLAALIGTMLDAGMLPEWAFHRA